MTNLAFLKETEFPSTSIVTGDAKRIFLGNPRRKGSIFDPDQPSTYFQSLDRFGLKAMLCVWWDQEGIV